MCMRMTGAPVSAATAVMRLSQVAALISLMIDAPFLQQLLPHLHGWYLLILVYEECLGNCLNYRDDTGCLYFRINDVCPGREDMPPISSILAPSLTISAAF